MKTAGKLHNYIGVVIAALFLTVFIWCPADVYGEKADPEITYQIPPGLDLSWDSFCLHAETVNCQAQLTYSTPAPSLLQVDQTGTVTIINHTNSFSAPIRISAAETETTKAKEFYLDINVDWVPQEVRCKSKYRTTLGKPVTIKAKALGKLHYTSSDRSVAKVSSAGKVTFLHPGSVTIRIHADNTGIYWSGEKRVSVSCRMTAPKLTVTRPGSRCAKLTWSKVGGAQQYLIYVKYPGKKKYRPVLSKSARVKSVTHKRLKKGRRYSYKVRAYVISGGDIYYGPYSKTVTVRIR